MQPGRRCRARHVIALQTVVLGTLPSRNHWDSQSISHRLPAVHGRSSCRPLCAHLEVATHFLFHELQGIGLSGWSQVAKEPGWLRRDSSCSGNRNFSRIEEDSPFQPERRNSPRKRLFASTPLPAQRDRQSGSLTPQRPKIPAEHRNARSSVCSISISCFNELPEPGALACRFDSKTTPHVTGGPRSWRSTPPPDTCTM
jgi:hypothetical protein